VGLLEGGLQLTYRMTVGMWLSEWWAIPIYEPDPVRGYRVRSHLDFKHQTREFSVRYVTGRTGMRVLPGEVEPVTEKGTKVYRVLSLGPSFAFGWGADYQDAYITQLCQRIAVPGRTVELVNLGTPSQPISYQLRWLKEVGWRYEPDLIVQTVYGDLETMESTAEFPLDGPVVVDGHLFPTARMTPTLWIRRLRRYSALLFYGWHFKQALLPSTKVIGDGREFYREELLNRDSDAAIAGAIRRCEQYVAQVRASAQEPPAVVFVVIPPSHVVRPADFARVAHHGGTMNPIRRRQLTAEVVAAARERGFHVVDTTPALVERDRQARTYYLYDIHFTREGNQAVVDALLPQVERLLPGAAGAATPGR